MNGKSDIWIADGDIKRAQVQAAATTPEDAILGLRRVWQEHCDRTGADPDILREYAADITVRKVELGKGYVQMTTDHLWFENIMNGDDERLSEVWSMDLESSSPTP